MDLFEIIGLAWFVVTWVLAIGTLFVPWEII